MIQSGMMKKVLILVLVEDGLGVRAPLLQSVQYNWVLILVLVEDGLGGKLFFTCGDAQGGLNPCFSGGWSRSCFEDGSPKHFLRVLILVLVEDGLGGHQKIGKQFSISCLNPCFSGGWSRRM